MPGHNAKVIPRQRSSSRIPSTGRRAARYFRRWRVVPQGICRASQFAFPAPVGLRAEGRGCQELRRLQVRRRPLRARTFRNRQYRHHSLELLLADRGQPRRRRHSRGSRKSSAIRSRNSRTACVSVETDTMTLRIECRERRPQRMRSGGRCFDLGYGNFTVSDVMIDVLGFHPVAGFK